MKQFLCVVAVLCLATSGCTSNRVMGPYGQRGGILSQRALRPTLLDQCCDTGCDPGCGCDVCCEPACGEPMVCCEPECGCDPGCGVYDPCCSDDGCSTGDGLFNRLGVGGRGNGGIDDGSICAGCGDPNCRGCLGGRAFAHNIASGFCPHAGGYPEMPTYNPGPPTGQVAYPYYTTRGPRDFLQNNPPSIGPY